MNLTLLIVLLLFSFPCNYCNEELEKILEAVEESVKELAEDLLHSYQNRCQITDCKCSHLACYHMEPNTLSCDKSRGQFPNCACSNEGSLISYNYSTVRLAGGPHNLDVPIDQMKTLECWTQKLEPTMSRIISQNPKFNWIYVGTPQGLHRGYPGRSRDSCNSYDLRLRPWYISATSGPKDIIIIIDNSASMYLPTFGLDLAKKAAKSVLDTLTFSDYIGIITFNSEASYTTNDTLIAADINNINLLYNAVDELAASGLTNYESAFSYAFQMIEKSYETNKTSHCQSAILFLTDGKSTYGKNGTELLEEIEKNNTRGTAIFTYSLGSDADIDLPKKIACQNKGIWTHIPDTEGYNLVALMGQYHKYFSTLNIGERQISWLEPYQDTSGSGMLTGASLAVYDEGDIPKLIGVAHVDINLPTLLTVEPDYEKIIMSLASRSRVCPNITFDACQLEALRMGDLGGNNSVCNDAGNCKPSDIDILNCVSSTPRYCSNFTPSDYQNQMCCCGSINPQLAIYVGAGLGGGAVLLALLILIFVLVSRKKVSNQDYSIVNTENLYGPESYM